MHAALIEHELPVHAVVAEHLAVIAREDDERVVSEAEVVEALENLADPVVHFRDHAVVDASHLLNERRAAIEHTFAGTVCIRRIGPKIANARRHRDALRRIHAVVRLRHDHRRMRRADGNGEREGAVFEPIQCSESFLRCERSEAVLRWSF